MFLILLLTALLCWIFIAIIVLALITLIKYGGLVCFLLVVVASVVLGVVIDYIFSKRSEH